MLTSTHMLLGAVVSTRPHFSGRLIASGWLGGVVPDLSIVVMFAISRLMRLTPGATWQAPNGMYWQEPWQEISAISNSIPLWAGLSLLGWFLFQYAKKLNGFGLYLLVFSIAALTHTLGDFPVHTDDAHVHFWPFSDWRYYSLVSYYQSANFGGIFRVFEMASALGLAGYLIFRFRQWQVRILAVLLGIAPIVMGFLAQMLF